MKKNFVVVLLLIVLQVQTLLAQKAETLTNKMVIDLYQAGLGKETLISKIQTSDCRFDVTTNGLLQLAKQKVPDEIIKAMVMKGDSKMGLGTAGATLPKVPQQKGPELPVINQINFVHYFDKGNAAPLEKLLGESKGKRKSFGYGGVEMKIEIPQEVSSVKLQPDAADTFLVNSGGIVPNLVLYKLKTEKNKRIAMVGKLTISGPKSSDDAIAVEVSKMGENLYLLKPGKPLDKGEYFFTTKPDINQSMSASDVYAFSVQ